MNSTLCRSTDTYENVVQDTGKLAENAYATLPMLAVQPFYQQLDEEELHTSFEEAISDRLIALHSRLDRISRPLPNTQDLCYETDPIMGTPLKNTAPVFEHIPVAHMTDGQVVSEHVSSRSMANSWQRITIFASLALMFMLLGFDLMGYLVLQHMH